MTSIKQWAYTIFSFCFFLVAALFLTILGFLLLTLGGKTAKHKEKYHQILQTVSKFAINHVPGTSFTYQNDQNESFKTPSIIISNHQSHLDLMGIIMLTPKLIILTKNWVWHNPFYGFIIRYADFFPMTDKEQMLNDLHKKVNEGYSIMIFPEGTRSADCRILRFHRGAFYLAEELNLDIVPILIKGFGEVLPKKSFHLYPGNMSLEVLPKINRKDIADLNFREVTKKVHQLYIERIREKVCHHR